MKHISILLLFTCLLAACSNEENPKQVNTKTESTPPVLETFKADLRKELSKVDETISKLEKDLRTQAGKIIKLEDELVDTHKKIIVLNEAVKPQKQDSPQGDKISNPPPLKLLNTWLTYDSTGKPEVHVLLKNVTTRTVAGYKLNIYCYDKFYTPVQGRTGVDNRFEAKGVFVIEPGKTHGKENFWTLIGFENTAKVEVEFAYIRYADGAEWEPFAGQKYRIKGDNKTFPKDTNSKN